MKKLTVLLAVLIALVLAMPCALAEDSTAYSLTIMDPALLVDGEAVVDLTGLNLDLYALVTDGGDQAALLNLYSDTDEGENDLTKLQIQFSEEGIVMYLDGMENSYCIPYEEIAALADNAMASAVLAQVPEMLKSLPLRSMLATYSEEIWEAADDVDVDELLWLPINCIQDEIALDENGEYTASFGFTKEESIEFFAQYAEMISSQGVNVDIDFDGMSMDGTLTVYGSDDAYTGYQVNASGIMTANDVDTAYTLYAEVDEETLSGTLAFPERNTEIVFGPETSDETTVDDAYAIELYEDGTCLGNINYTTGVESGRYEQLAMIIYGDAEDGSEDQIMAARVMSDFESEVAHSWDFQIFTYTGSGDDVTDYNCAYLSYYGNDTQQTSLGVDARFGTIQIGFVEDMTDTTLTFNVLEVCQNVDSSEWALDYAEAVDLLNMDESASNTAYMGLTGVISEVGATLAEQYPVFAQLFS